ncbi:MAG TPA: carboxypeptidase-like regulatory domain-containing protein [Bryobacteraceae bacterium]
MTGPTLKICDFGFGPHTLRVGTNECLPTTISNLRVVFGAPVHLKVIISACGWSELMGAACRLFLRVVDSEGKPLPDVDISPSMGTNPPQRTDSYGRYQSLMGGSYNLTFSKQGFEPATAPIVCPAARASLLVEEIDQQVVMNKVR